MKGMKGYWGGKYWIGNRVLGIGLLMVFSLVGSFNSSATTAAPVKLSWEASADPDVTGYAVYYGVVNSGPTNRMDVGASRTASLKTLQAGFNYFFFVAAYKQGGFESDPSNVIQYTPPAITRLKMAPQRNGAIRVQFRGPAATLCRVEYTESLTPPQWQTLGSTTTDTEGNIIIDDPLAGRPAGRFYRGVLP
jgi:hypothetical protein